jgi:hypothetical protein
MTIFVGGKAAKLKKLSKILGMLGSAHDGERASAALKACELLREAGMTWDEVVAPDKLPVISSATPRCSHWKEIAQVDPHAEAEGLPRWHHREGASASGAAMSAPLTRQQLVRLSLGRRSLAGVHRSWGTLNKAQGAWLLNQGVSAAALLEPSPVGATRVRFLDGNTFDVAGTEAGTGALTFRINVGEDIDIIAWSPRTGEIGAWYGRGFCLGQDQIDNPATYFDGDALRIHRTPLDWLKADREGVCIVQPDRTYAMLRHVPRVSFADFDTAKKFEAWIKAPAPRVEMFVEGISA